MIKKLIIGFLSVVSLQSITAATYTMGIEPTIYEGRIIVGDIQEATPQRITTLEGSYHNGTDTSPGWNNYNHSCSVSQSVNYVQISHGAYTCYRDLNIEPIQFDADSEIDISFNVRRVSYGSNYTARFIISGLFYWYYSRDASDWIRYGYNSDGGYKQIGNSYNTYRNYRIHYIDGVLRYYHDGNLVDEIEDFTPPTVTNGVIRGGVNNSRIRVGNIQIKITEPVE